MKIITISSGNTQYIDIQYNTLKKYMKSDYEFIVINACVTKEDFSNFNDPYIIDKAKKKCEDLNINFLNLFDETKNEQIIYNNIDAASCRHSYVLRRVVKYIKEHPDKYLIIDSDIFLIDYFDINEYDDYNCAVVIQDRFTIKYLWAGFLYINIFNAPKLDLLTDFDTGVFENIITDTGGGTYKWIMNIDFNIPSVSEIRNSDYDFHNKNKIKYIKHLWSMSWNEEEYPSNLSNNILDFCKNDVRNNNNKFFCEIYDKKFLHIRGGSGWMNEGKSIHDDLSNKLYNVLCMN